jgi:rubrerythrin
VQQISDKEKQAEAPQDISAFLDNCIAIEKYTQTKYRELAKQTDNSRATDLFTRLSAGGEAHALILTEIKASLVKSGEIGKFVTIAAHLEIPKEDKIPTDSNARQTYHAMKLHLNLERDFKDVYTQLSEEVTNPTTQQLLRQLIIDETNHHKELKDLIKAFEEMYKLIFNKTMK